MTSVIRPGGLAFLPLFAMLLTAPTQAAEPDAASLKLITDTADKICNVVDTKGSAATSQTEGNVKAELTGLAAKLADVGVSGSIKLSDEKYENVLRQDLPSLLKDNAKCKMAIFDRLVDRIFKTAEVTQAAAARACFDRPGYPAGRWGVTTRNAPPAKYSTFVTFTQANRGTWLPSTGTGSFETSVPPGPRAEVIMTFKVDSDDPYRSVNRLVVSPDGCRMEGTFSDTLGHAGEAIYVYDAQP